MSPTAVKAYLSAYPVVVFAKSSCTFCHKLSARLSALSIPYNLIMLDSVSPALKNELIQMTGCKTVPQMFVGGKFFGGFSEFEELYKSSPFLDKDHALVKLLRPLNIKPVLADF